MRIFFILLIASLSTFAQQPEIVTYRTVKGKMYGVDSAGNHYHLQFGESYYQGHKLPSPVDVEKLMKEQQEAKGIQNIKEPPPKPIGYEEVVRVENADADELYYRAKMWMVDNFVDAQEVIQLDDQGKHMLVAKGVVSYDHSYMASFYVGGSIISFTLKVYAKDGRYKYELVDFIHKATNPNQGFNYGRITDSEKVPEGKGSISGIGDNLIWKRMQEQCIRKAGILINSLKEDMSKPYSEDDW